MLFKSECSLAQFGDLQVALVVKNLPANAEDARDSGFSPCVVKTPLEKEWQPAPVFLLENPMDRGAWWATVHEVAKNQIRPSMSRPGTEVLVSSPAFCTPRDEMGRWELWSKVNCSQEKAPLLGHDWQRGDTL